MRPQTAAEAWNYVQYLLRRLPFYKEHGYSVSLPTLAGISTSFANNADASDTERRTFDTEYSHVDFTGALHAIEAERATTDAALARLHSWPWFTPCDHYEVVLTPYGMGGSYNADAAKIIVKIPPDGVWRRPPSHAIIHEAVHVCTEATIVQRFRLTHGEKEALVDKLILEHLADLLPNYTPQRVRDSRIDAYLPSSVLRSLANAVQAYIHDHPRDDES